MISTQELRFILKAKDQASRDLRNVKGEMGGLSKSVGGFGKAAGLAATVGVGALIAGITALVTIGISAKRTYEEWMQTLDDFQDVTDLSAKNVSLLAAEFRLSDVDVNKAQKSIAIFTRRLGEARKGITTEAVRAFDMLGVSINNSDGKARPFIEVLHEARSELHKIKDPAERAAMASQLFGRGWTEMADWISKSNREMRIYDELIRDVGMVMGEESMRNFQQYRENQRIMAFAWDAIKVNAYAALVPLINDLMPHIISGMKIAAGWVGRFRKIVEKKGWAKAIEEMVPWLWDVIEELKKARVWWDENSDEIKSVVNSIVKVVKKVKDFGASVKETARLVKADFVRAWNGIKESASSAWDKIVGIFSRGKSRIVGFVNDIIDAANWVITKVPGVDNAPIPRISTGSRSSNGGTGGAPGGAARVSTPALMDNGGTGGVMDRLRGAAGTVGDWARGFMDKLDIPWPKSPGGMFGGLGGWLLKLVKDSLLSLIRKGGGRGQQIVEIAKSMLGVPYLWGGTSPAGFDCSGLIWWAYKQAGIDIPRTGMWNAGRQVGQGSARPGDIMFYTAGGASQGVRYGHVKMYAGDGRTIESTSGGVQMRPADWAGASEIRTYLSRGGIVSGPRTGYPVMLHGTEKVTPLDGPHARPERVFQFGDVYVDNADPETVMAWAEAKERFSGRAI